jgi:GrpB-like predicted nucleotidyltransferase (UPF0157 family)
MTTENKIPIIGLEKGKVKIVPYNKEWPTLFATEKLRITETLNQLKLSPLIAHVGSTAVEGIKAKPIVDIVIGFKNKSDMKSAFNALTKSGLVYIPAISKPGMIFLAKGDPRTYHYQLVVTGSYEWKKLILFRDYLRKNQGLAKEYEKLKVELADLYPENRIEYGGAKREFMNSIMLRAYQASYNKKVSKAFARVRKHAREPNTPKVLQRP